jgi:hypothetical protein
MNHENLTKLADYLDSLPHDYRQFTMCDFMTSPDDLEELRRYQTDPTYNMCGSAACAVGHGPNAGIKVDPSTFNKSMDEGELWFAYVSAAFGIEWDTPEAEFMFGAGWSYADNTPKGAAARIRYVLDGQVIPEDFDSYYSTDYEAVDLYRGYLK